MCVINHVKSGVTFKAIKIRMQQLSLHFVMSRAAANQLSKSKIQLEKKVNT